MAKYEDILKDIQNSTYTPIEQRTSSQPVKVNTTKKKKKNKIEELFPTATAKAKEVIGNKVNADKFSNIWSDGYQFGDVLNTLNTARETFTFGGKAAAKGKDAANVILNSDGSFFKSTKANEELKNIWSNGYQKGDILKSQASISKAILGTEADIVANLAKGELQTAEGLVDTSRYLVSDVADLAGADEYADKVRKSAIQNTTGIIFGEYDTTGLAKDNGWLKQLDEWSIFGNKMDQITQSVGQQAFRIGLQEAVGATGVGEGTTKALNQLEIFAGSYGSAKSEALSNGADYGTASLRGTISGVAETISENIFDAIPSFKTGELAKITNLKNVLYDAAEKSFGSGAGRVALRIFNGAGEGFEEIISNGLETISNDLINAFTNSSIAKKLGISEYTYGMKEGEGLHEDTLLENVWKLFTDIHKSNFSQESGEAFISAFFSTLITGGFADAMTTSERNKVINEYAKENKISKEKATELFDAIRDLRVEQVTTKETGGADMMELKDQATKQLAQEYQSAKQSGNKLDLEELFKATPKNRSQAQFTLSQNERENLTDNDVELAASLSRSGFNNTEKSHNLYSIGKMMQDGNKSLKVRFINNNDLQNMGIKVDQNKTVNGFHKGDTLYINLNGANAFETTIGHEIGEAIKAADTDSYNELKSLVKQVFTEQDLSEYTKAYTAEDGTMLTDNVEDEWVNDKLGELFENEDLRNRIADNRTLLQKVIDNIKILANKVTGKDKQQLKTLQQQLEDKFVELYKNTDFSKNQNKDAALSIIKNSKKQWVRADRQVISGNDPEIWAKQVENYINNNIRNNKDVIVYGADGDELTITSDTAGKATFRNDIKMADGRIRKMTDKEFAAKLRAEAHIDELAQTSTKGKKIVPDYKEHSFAKDGFNYRTAYFEDEDGSYYRITMSVGLNGDIKTIYNVGKMNNLSNKNETGKISGSKAKPVSLDKSISQNEQKVNKTQEENKFDLKTQLRKQAEQIAENTKSVRQDILDYIAENNLQNPTVEEMMNAFDTYDIMDNTDVDPEFIAEAEELYRQVAQDIYNENNKNQQIPTEKINATVKGEFKTYDNYYDFAKDFTNNKEDLAKELLLKNYTYEFEIPTNKNETMFYHGGNNVNDYDAYTIMDYDEHLMDRNYGDYFYITTDKDFAHIYGNQIAEFVIPNNKIMSLEKFNKSGLTEEQAFNKYWAIEMPDGEYIVKDVDAIKNYSKQKALEFIDNQEGNKNKTQVSLTTNKDSNGRTLTTQQQEYFKDSKVVDENGNLKVMYHGSSKGDYTVFDKNKIGGNTKNKGIFGNGFYFTENRELADSYDHSPDRSGKTFETYLNMTNPFYWNDIKTEEQLNELNKELELKNPLKWNRIMEEVHSISPLGKNDTNYGDPVELTNALKQKGYDGIIYKYDNTTGEYIVFESNQIKNVDNTNPTSNEDIRYSLSPTGEMVDNNGYKVTFEVSEVETDLPIRDDAKLMVLHNLGEGKMNGIMELNGIPSPSIAITDPSIVNHSNFGEGTLIFNKSTIDPTNRLNEVYDRDVWSPTQPEIEYEILENKLDEVANKLGIEYWELLDYTKRVQTPENLVQLLNGNEIIKEKVDNGLDLAKEVEKIYGERGIRNDKDYLTPTGNRRSFWQLHEKYNLDNLVKALTKGKTKGTQKFFPGYGQIQSKMAQRYKSIEDIKAHSNLLQETPSHIEARARIEDDIDQIVANNDTDYLIVSELLADFADGKMTIDNFRNLTSKYYQTTQNVSDELIQKTIDDLNNLKNLPTKYFEAKPQRAVGLDEIGMALIPNTWSEETKQRMQEKGIRYIEYDPSIEGERQRIEKELTDYMFSLTSNENIKNIPIKDDLTYQQDVIQRDISPIREDISNLTNQVNNLSKQIETLQNQSENANTGYVEAYNPQRYENQEYNALNENEAETYSNALMSDEAYLKSLETMADNYVEPGGIERQKIVKISNRVGNELGLSSQQTIELQKMIDKYATEDYTEDEILNDLSREFGVQSYEETRQEIKDAKKIIRATPLNVSESIKNDITDYKTFKNSNMGKLHFARSGLAVDVAYEQLANGELQGILDPDIINPTDQLLELSRVANENVNYKVEIPVDQEQLENMADYIHENLINARYQEQMANFDSLNNAIENEPEIAPTTIRTQESIDNTIENRDIAPIRQEEVNKQNPNYINRAANTWRTIQETMVNRNYVIDKFAKTTKNKQVKFKGDAWNNVASEAQYNINNYQTDNNYNRVGKSVKALFEPAKQAGLYDAFNDYLLQKSNIERTNQSKGSAIPYQISVQLVNMYEAENPQFKTWAKDIYKYFDNVLQGQVDSGLITQEQYDYFRGENGIYRSYVPFYPGEFVAGRYFDNEGNLKTPTTLKRSKGGANSILAVEDSMMKQTYAYKSAIRQNDLFKEIVSTLGENDNGMGAELRGNPTDTDMSLFIDPETNDKYVTAYIDGERYASKISDELYNELGKVKEGQAKELEDNLSGILKPIQKASNIRRNLLTTWNPIFLLRNGIKDIQDAVINSKQTGDMLKAYFGIGEKAAILELKAAKTKEAQQFLAAYGSEGTYGDYSGNTKSRVVNAISNINELIELAPRFAEFKATLKNGGTVNEAIYNAREVTTNFGRGGYIAKAMNRNGFTFLNANIQGLDKLVRNVSGENGVKGVTSVVVKGALFGILPAVLNELAFGGAGDEDKDKDYEALPDYVKDNYYLIKLENGQFLRIPKGRILSVIGSAARRTIEAAEGEEDAYNGYLQNAWSQIGVGDSGGLQTIFTPITQAVKNEAWYGGDIVPTRLQNLPAEEQYDEKTDAVSKKIGEIFKVSPKKVNYVIDQYSGGIGDLLLPTITPATSNGAEGIGYMTAPLKDAFVINSTDDNKYPSEFYTLKDELQKKSNSSNATDEDKLAYKYLNSVNGQLAKLYTERRETQADTELSKSEKYELVQNIQKEINRLSQEGIANSKIISKTDNYATVGDIEYYLDDEGEWTKLNDNDTLDTAGMTGSEKATYFKAKSNISTYNKEYKEKTKDLDKNEDADLISMYAEEKKQKTIQAIINSGLSNQDKATLYANYYSTQETMDNVVNAGYDVDTYIIAINDITELRDKYSQKKGYSTAYRKKMTQSYINSLNMSEVQKAMLFRQYYSSYDAYNSKILNYVQNLDISNEEKLAILKQCKFEITQKNGSTRISW